MIVSNDRIRALLSDLSVPPTDRLAITPLLDFDAQIPRGGCSVDVRLGQRFRVPRRTKLDSLDHLSLTHRSAIERYQDDYHVLLGDYFVLHPQQFILGETLEWIHLPSNLAAYVIGRSSWGRDGLIIATATGVHPRYSGILTLEITNVGEIPLRLYPGSPLRNSSFMRSSAVKKAESSLRSQAQLGQAVPTRREKTAT